MYIPWATLNKIANMNFIFIKKEHKRGCQPSKLLWLRKHLTTNSFNVILYQWRSNGNNPHALFDGS